MAKGRENSHQTGVGKELRGWHVRVIHMDTRHQETARL